MELNWPERESSLLQISGRDELSKAVEFQMTPSKASDTKDGNSCGFCVYHAESQSCLGQSFPALPMFLPFGMRMLTLCNCVSEVSDLYFYFRGTHSKEIA